MATARAAVLVEYRRPLEVREVEIPEPEPGGLVVEVVAATVCGTDHHIYNGEIASSSRLPLIPGHEIIGEVVASRRERDSLGRPLAVGDRVAWAYAWCGACFYCTVAKEPALCERPRRYGWGPVTEYPYLTGGFADHAYVLPRCEVVKVPDGLDPALAATATCALRTVVHAYDHIGGVAPGDHVVVQGSGPVGLYATAYAALAGARVICIGAPEDRLALARRFGATLTLSVLDTTVAERRAAVRAATEGRGADLLVECSGAAAALPEGVELGRPGARYAVIGQTNDEPPITIRPNVFTLGQLTIAGVRSGDITHYHRALELLAQHSATLPFHELLGHRYPLEGVTDAIEATRSMKEIKPVIVPAGA